MTLAALRLRTLYKAIGGLLGSKLFDLVIIGIDDAVYTKGPLLRAVSPVHAVTAFSAVMLSGAVIVGLVLHPHRRLLGAMSIIGAALLLLYLLNASVLFVRRA